MELKITTKLSADTAIETIFEGSDLQKAVKKAGAILAFERKCGNCGNDNFTLQTRSSKDKQYHFTEFICQKCEFRRRVCFNKDGEGTYLGSWEPKWEGPTEGDN